MSVHRDLLDLVDAIHGWCRLQLTNAADDGEASERVITVVLQLFPEMENNLRASPASVSVRVVIDTCVKRANNKHLSMLWVEHYVHGATVLDITRMSNDGYSRRSFGRLKKRFARIVVDQLWAPKLETIREQLAQQEQEYRIQEQRKQLLISEYGFSSRQAEVALVFCNPKGHLGRLKIQQQLGIGKEGLRAHISKINRKLGASTMTESTAKIMAFLQKHPEARWKDD
jgi:hypothetical protein